MAISSEGNINLNRSINTLGVTWYVMLYGVMQNPDLHGRWKNHFLQWHIVWTVGYGVWQMFCQGVANEMAIVADVVTTVLNSWQMLCQGVADGMATYIELYLADLIQRHGR